MQESNLKIKNKKSMTTNLLTTEAAAEYLGIKKSYLHKLMMNKLIPYYKPNGKLCYFEREDLDKWMRHIRIATQEEVDQEAIAYITNKDIVTR
jgi:excisionase family DNA binding protein